MLPRAILPQWNSWRQISRGLPVEYSANVKITAREVVHQKWPNSWYKKASCTRFITIWPSTQTWLQIWIQALIILKKPFKQLKILKLTKSYFPLQKRTSTWQMGTLSLTSMTRLLSMPRRQPDSPSTNATSSGKKFRTLALPIMKMDPILKLRA